MNEKCKIIMDLLPLYIENMTSEESNKFIEEHIGKCPQCKKELDSLKSDFAIEEDLNTAPIKFIKDELKKDRRSLVLIVLLSFISVSIIAFSFLTKPKYLNYNNDLLKIVETEENITISSTKRISGMEVRNYGISPDTNKHEYFISLWDTNLGDMIGNKKLFLENIPKGENISIYYSENNENPAKLLYGKPSDGGVILLPRLAMNMYSIAALIVGVILFVISFALKFTTVKKVLISGLPISFFLSSITLNGFKSGATHHLLRDLFYVILLAISYYFIFIVIGLILNRRKRY